MAHLLDDISAVAGTGRPGDEKHTITICLASVVQTTQSWRFRGAYRLWMPAVLNRTSNSRQTRNSRGEELGMWSGSRLSSRSGGARVPPRCPGALSCVLQWLLSSWGFLDKAPGTGVRTVEIFALPCWRPDGQKQGVVWAGLMPRGGSEGGWSQAMPSIRCGQPSLLLLGLWTHHCSL